MAGLGEKVTFHTVNGPAVAFVIGHRDGEFDTELAVLVSSRVEGDDTGLGGTVARVWSHEDDKPGGFTS